MSAGFAGISLAVPPHSYYYHLSIITTVSTFRLPPREDLVLPTAQANDCVLEVIRIRLE